MLGLEQARQLIDPIQVSEKRDQNKLPSSEFSMSSNVKEVFLVQIFDMENFWYGSQGKSKTLLLHETVVVGLIKRLSRTIAKWKNPLLNQKKYCLRD